jgi:serine/threonine-protein kinase RsbW
MPRIEFKIDGTFDNIRLVGQAINTICINVCSTSTAYQIELATVEVCNNIVEHAYYETSGEIFIELTLDNSHLTLKFVDTGIPIPESLLQPASIEFDKDNLETLPEGGMGLYLIENIMDTREYAWSNNQNILTVTKQLRTRV